MINLPKHFQILIDIDPDLELEKDPICSKFIYEHLDECKGYYNAILCFTKYKRDFMILHLKPEEAESYFDREDCLIFG